jgi:hypothetical protein
LRTNRSGRSRAVLACEASRTVGRAQRSERVPGRAFCEFEIAKIDSEPQT